MTIEKVSTVLVPGAAGPAGINTIKSLKMARFDGSTIATDSNPLAAGFYLASSYQVMPEIVDESTFLEKLVDIVTRHSVQILMPSSGYDIFPYSKYRRVLEDIGAMAVVSDRDRLEICRDKMLTYNTLRGQFNLPFTTLDHNKVSSFPMIAKPRFGKGSRDVITIEDENDLRYVSSKYKEMIYQEFLPGTEYTVDVLCDLERKPIVAVPRKRIQTKAGISMKGKVVRHAELEERCMEIAQTIGITGPCCIQMKESDEGQLKLVEINPRMGGGTIFTAIAGANFPKLIIDMVEGREIAIPRIKEITIVRYFEEIVVEEPKEVEATAAAYAIGHEY